MIDTLVSFNLPDNHTNLGSAPDIASGVPLLEDVVARPVGGRLWRGRRIKRVRLVSLEIKDTLGNVLENKIGPDVNLLQSET